MKAPDSPLLELDTSLSGRMSLLGSSLIIHLLSLVLPLTMMQVYDRIILYRNESTLIWLVTGCAMAILIECILRNLRSRLGQLLAARFEYRTTANVINHLMESDLKSFEKTSSSEHLDRVNALGGLRNFYAGQLYQVALDLPFALVFYLTIAWLGGWIVILPMALGLGYIGLVLYCRHRFSRSHEVEQDATVERQGFLEQLLNHLPTVKSLNMEEQMLRRYERLQFKKVDTQSRANFWADLPG